MSVLTAPNLKWSGRLPMDMETPNYGAFDGPNAAQKLDAVRTYITRDEFRELSAITNEAADKHSPLKSYFAMFLLFASLGICICPFVSKFMQYEANVNGDVGVSDIAQRLRSRGIEVEWSCKTKFQTGGMTFVLASHTQPIS